MNKRGGATRRGSSRDHEQPGQSSARNPSQRQQYRPQSQFSQGNGPPMNAAPPQYFHAPYVHQQQNYGAHQVHSIPYQQPPLIPGAGRAASLYQTSLQQQPPPQFPQGYAPLMSAAPPQYSNAPYVHQQQNHGAHQPHFVPGAGRAASPYQTSLQQQPPPLMSLQVSGAQV